MANKPWEKKRTVFRETLRELRDSKGLTQSELGERLGRQQSYISKYENGERRLDYLEVLEIVDACEYSLHELQAAYKTKMNAKT